MHSYLSYSMDGFSDSKLEMCRPSIYGVKIRVEHSTHTTCTLHGGKTQISPNNLVS